MSIKKSNDTIGNRTRDLLSCSAVPEPTALPRAPNRYEYQEYFLGGKGGRCVGPTTLPPYVSIVLKSGSPILMEPSGLVQACNGIAVPLHLCGVTTTGCLE